MADPYTDEAIEALERMLQPGDDWPSEAIIRLLATIRAGHAAHRQEMDETHALLATSEAMRAGLQREIAERDARIAELEEAPRRPISEAPRDGSLVLIYRKPVYARWRSRWWDAAWAGKYHDQDVTHFEVPADD